MKPADEFLCHIQSYRHSFKLLIRNSDENTVTDDDQGTTTGGDAGGNGGGGGNPGELEE